MDFNQAHQKLLDKLDKAYDELRLIHEDERWVNANQEYQDKLNHFLACQKRLFEFKAVWMELREQ